MKHSIVPFGNGNQDFAQADLVVLKISAFSQAFMWNYNVGIY